ncbi:peroxiredoxin [Chondromyces apiculatus]|uniref:thioredoxin-dependent peroxiredoxin n=1 Tax=Chondromyces apiculatus DSM 436 TaxID=1192034 RepID=A0A017T2P6_9BACT|nr:peroxiredoxin [Chondromyces apiculatus]EYF03524.1 Alkyl hydroperoxide reductase subunit C-like protein [Chondromyces apiculatus DSM 436]
MFGKSSLAVGDRAPEFSLQSQKQETVKLSDFLGKKTLVVFFYPKDDTPGCTAESCSFRDSHDDFTEAGAEVIGISGDSAESHGQFAKKYGLPMTLLSDPGGQTAKSYGVKSTLGILPGRVTFVIDKEGIVRHVFSSQLQATKHVSEALAIVKQLEGASKN